MQARAGLMAHVFQETDLRVPTVGETAGFEKSISQKIFY